MTIRFTFTAPSSWSATTPWCSCFKFLGCFLVYFVFCSALRIVVVPPSPSRITRLEPPSHPHLRLPSWSASSPSSGWDVDVDVDMVVAVARLFNVWVLFEFIEWIPGKTQEFVFGLSVVFGSALCFLFFLILLFFDPRSECTWCIKIAYGVLNFSGLGIGFPKLSVRVCRDKGWTGDYDFFSGTPNYVRSAGNRWRSTSLAPLPCSPKMPLIVILILILMGTEVGSEIRYFGVVVLPWGSGL